MDIVKLLTNRYTTKLFDPTKKLTAEQVEQVKQSLRWSISSLNSQPWHFFIASGVKKDELSQYAMDFNQKKVQDASHLVIFCAKNYNEEHVQSVVKDTKNTRGDDAIPDFYVNWLRKPIGAEPDSEDTKAWVNRQVYLSVGMFISSMAMIGIDVCPIEGFYSDKLDNALGFDGNLRSLVIAPIGFHSEDDFNHPSKSPKVRLPMGKIITEL